MDGNGIFISSEKALNIISDLKKELIKNNNTRNWFK